MSAGCYDKRERGTKPKKSTTAHSILNQMVQGEVKSFAPLVAKLAFVKLFRCSCGLLDLLESTLEGK